MLRNPKILENFLLIEKKLKSLHFSQREDSSLSSAALSWFLTVLQQKAAFLVKVRYKALSKIIYLTFPAFLSIV